MIYTLQIISILWFHFTTILFYPSIQLAKFFHFFIAFFDFTLFLPPPRFFSDFFDIFLYFSTLFIFIILLKIFSKYTKKYPTYLCRVFLYLSLCFYNVTLCNFHSALSKEERKFYGFCLSNMT